MRKLTNCPKMVAQAAPWIPISSTKIATGSPMMLITAPVSMAAIAYCGLPSARMTEARAFCVMARGIMAKMITP